MESFTSRLLIIDKDTNEIDSLASVIKGSELPAIIDQSDNEGSDKLLEQINQNHYDVILSAVQPRLPDIYSLLTTIDQSGKKIPLILLMDPVPEDISPYLKAGAADIIKSTNHEHLLISLKKIIDIQKQWKKLAVLQKELNDAQKYCKKLLSTSNNPIAYISDGLHVYANQAYMNFFGFLDEEELFNTPFIDLVEHEDRPKIKKLFKFFMTSKLDESDITITFTKTSQKNSKTVIHISPLEYEDEHCLQIQLTAENEADIHTNEHLEEQVKFLSQRDLMTGLYNRKYLMDQLKEAVLDAKNSIKNSSLIYIGLDRFESLKQTFGISGIDLLLTDFGKFLETQLKDPEIACRFETDRFVVLSETWKQDELKKLMNQLITSFNNHIVEIDGKSVNTSATLGAAIIDENTPSPNEIIVRAEHAYKDALTRGNGAVIYQPRKGELTQSQIDKHWADELTYAIEQKRIQLLFQPIVNLQGNVSFQYNVFTRLLDEKGHPIPAREFMPSIERSGAARILDRWVIKEAVEILSQNSSSSLKLFAKLSAGSLQDSEILNWLATLLREKQVSGDRIVFEIKTQVAINYLKQTRIFQKGLSQLHSHLLLDDFGTVSKPFLILKQIPAEFLKFDSSITDNLINNPEQQDMLRELVLEAHEQKRLVVAQCIEDPNTLSLLYSLEIDYVQGNFLQIPSTQMNFDFDAIG